MDPITQQQALAAAGAGGDKVYVEDVFSTFLYDGAGATQTITNGIDLSGEGGMVWLKGRTDAGGSSAFGGDINHILLDTERSGSKPLVPNLTEPQSNFGNVASGGMGFLSNGFQIGYNGYDSTNYPGNKYVSWTFRKAPGFFDIVTYTGSGIPSENAWRYFTHSLGSTPGMVIVKRTDSAGPWVVAHADKQYPYYTTLNTSDAATGGGVSGTPGYVGFSGSNNFYISNGGANTTPNDLNIQNATYVAYIFGNDDPSFGNAGNESIIKCGSYTGNGSATAGPEINLGFEPQFILAKNISSSTRGGVACNWRVYDIMRGITAGNTYASIFGNERRLFPNLNNPEDTSEEIDLTATGFKVTSASGSINYPGETFIYMAIRRPHKPPTAGTDVFNALVDTHTQSARSITGVGFSPDLVMNLTTSHASHQNHFMDRMRGPSNYLNVATSSAQVDTTTAGVTSFDQDGITLGNGGHYIGINSPSGDTSVKQYLRRAPGFFDIVSYVGTSSSQLVNHNLNAVPELIIVKSINQPSTNWGVYHKDVGNTSTLQLNSDSQATTTPNAIYWNNTTPTSSAFTVGSTYNVNLAYTYIAYLFASLPGISKVGSFSGTGSNIDVDCGFTNGARYVLIKRTDAAPPVYGGSWYVWDTARGIVSGNDPFTELNYGGAQTTNTDYIDPLSSGFTVTSSAPAQLNASGGSYIFLAIA